MSPTSAAEHHSDRATPMAGGLLALCTLLGLVMVLHHPTVRAHDSASLIGQIRALSGADRLVHGVITASFVLLTACLLRFGLVLGLRRAFVGPALLCCLLGLVFLCLATLTDGFVVPALAAGCSGDACAGPTTSLLTLCAAQIEVLTRFALLTLAGATVLWSADLALRRDLVARGAAAAGLVSATVQIGLLASPMRLTPASLLTIVAAQALWNLAAALLMAARLGPFKARSAAPAS